MRYAILCGLLVSAVSVAGQAAAGEAPADSQQDGASRPAASKSSDENPQDEPEKKLFTGNVVMAYEALQARDIEAYKKELEGQVVLKTPDGALIPILPDWRGRAFYQDERLRNRRVELVGYRQQGLPWLQVLMVFTFKDGERQYTDYWCDVCRIPMYEIKPCDCCQGPVRLRFQPRDLPDYIDKPASGDAAQTEKQAVPSAD